MATGQVAGGELAAAFGFGPTLLVFAVVLAAYLPFIVDVRPSRKRERRSEVATVAYASQPDLLRQAG